MSAILPTARRHSLWFCRLCQHTRLHLQQRNLTWDLCFNLNNHCNHVLCQKSERNRSEQKLQNWTQIPKRHSIILYTQKQRLTVVAEQQLHAIRLRENDDHMRCDRSMRLQHRSRQRIKGTETTTIGYKILPNGLPFTSRGSQYPAKSWPVNQLTRQSHDSQSVSLLAIQPISWWMVAAANKTP